MVESSIPDWFQGIDRSIFDTTKLPKITLLGKRLEEYPQTYGEEQALIRATYNVRFAEVNKQAHLIRFADDFEKEALSCFVMDGNSFKTTDEIIASVRVIGSLGVLSDEQWQRAVPIIERGLEANKAYVRMLDEIAPILDRYFSEFADVNMHYTIMHRVKLEMWQGRFNEGHWANPNKGPHYS